MILSWVELVKAYFRLIESVVKMLNQLGFLKVFQTQEVLCFFVYGAFDSLDIQSLFIDSILLTFIYLAYFLQVLFLLLTMVALLASEQR